MSQRAVLLAAWADIPVAETEEIYPTAETGDDFALAFIKTVSRSASSMSKPFGWGVSSERAPQLVSLAISGTALAQNESRQLREKTLQTKSYSSLGGNAEVSGGTMPQRAVLLAALADIRVGEAETIYQRAAAGDDSALGFIKTVNRIFSSMSKPLGWGVASEHAPKLVSLAMSG